MSVSLVKGQRISLEKDGGSLSNVFMGLGWDAAQKKGFFGFMRSGDDIDLDASCVMIAEDASTLIDVVYFGNLHSKDGSVIHSGDNLTGEGEGDDEVINVNLKAVPPQVAYLVFTISSYRGQTFDTIQNAFCRLVDKSTNREIAKYEITGGGNYTGMIMAVLYRKNNEWKMRAIGEKAHSKTVGDLVDLIFKIL